MNTDTLTNIRSTVNHSPITLVDPRDAEIARLTEWIHGARWQIGHWKHELSVSEIRCNGLIRENSDLKRRLGRLGVDAQ